MCRIVNGKQAYLIVDQIVTVGLLIDVNADSQYLNLRQLLLHSDQRGQLGGAGDTPARPEVQNDDLAPVVGKMNVSISIGYGKVRGRAAGLARMGAAVAAGCKDQKSGQDETDVL